MAPWRGHQIVAYHKQWEYLTNWLGLEILDYVEVRAGIPPSPRHVVALEELIHAKQVDVILMSNYFEPGPAEKLAERTGAHLLILPASVEGEDEIEDPIALFDRLVAALDAAFQNGRAR
jgi:zinc/manganese transport system substrate-binding protein